MDFETLKRELMSLGLTKQETETVVKAITGVKVNKDLYDAINDIVLENSELNQFRDQVSQLAVGPLKPMKKVTVKKPAAPAKPSELQEGLQKAISQTGKDIESRGGDAGKMKFDKIEVGEPKKKKEKVRGITEADFGLKHSEVNANDDLAKEIDL